MSLDLLLLQTHLLELRYRLLQDLELWSRYSSLAHLESAKELAQEKLSLLHRQLAEVKDLLLQLEHQMETVNWKTLQLESRKEWD
jgi:hypothetical protein